MDLKKIRITKTFAFDMAHALYNHDGLCRNIHGHTYILEVTLLGEPLLDPGHAKDGMVMDFTDLKALVKREVIDIYDHALVLKASSATADITAIKLLSQNVILMDRQPTCENLLLDIVARISKNLANKTTLMSVKLQETPTSFCEWNLYDND